MSAELLGLVVLFTVSFPLHGSAGVNVDNSDITSDGGKTGDRLLKLEHSNDNDYHHKKACEAGYPCDKDQWCSPSRNVCRSCSDLDYLCNQTELIHNTYVACESYCYKKQIAETKSCEAKMEQTHRETNSILVMVRREAEAEKTNLSTKIAQLEQSQRARESEQAQQISNLKKSLNQYKEQAPNDRLVQNVLIAVIGVLTLLCIATTLFAVFMYRRKVAPERDEEAAEGAAALPEKDSKSGDSAQPLIDEEARSPVAVAGTDVGEFAFNEQAQGVRVTGDSDVIP